MGSWWFGPRRSPARPRSQAGGEARGGRRRCASAQTCERRGQPGTFPGAGGCGAGRGAPRDRAREGSARSPGLCGGQPGGVRKAKVSGPHPLNGSPARPVGPEHQGRPWHPRLLPSTSALRRLSAGGGCLSWPIPAGSFGLSLPLAQAGPAFLGRLGPNSQAGARVFQPRVSRATGEGVGGSLHFKFQ